MATAAQRQHLHALMGYLIQVEPQVHYAQVRPMHSVHLTERQLDAILAHGGSVAMDCSEAVTCLCKWAGLHDPNGLGYSGLGFTGTLLEHLPHYFEPKHANVGALCVYGPAPGDHVAMVYERGPDPLMWSHGAENGPRLIRQSAEAAFHRPPFTFLSITHL